MNLTIEQIDARSKAIAAWWADKMQKPLNQNNGDDSPAGGLAFLLMNMNAGNAQDSISPKKIQRFQDLLVIALKNPDIYTAYLGVDYHPDDVLYMACATADIDPGCLPIKSSTSINMATGIATGRYQYGGKEEIIWQPTHQAPEATELTLEFLQNPNNRGTVFATGVADEPGLHSEPIRWVAKVGDGYHDWAIYYHLENTPVAFIKTNGEKVTTESIIRKLVPCTDEAYSFYRR